MKAAHVLIHAPAKINLILRVLDRRPDGFHEIWSLMQTVGLYDELRIAVRPASSPSIDLRCDHAALAADRTNLVHRAAALVLERADRGATVAIELQKRIPLGAGLGGGSFGPDRARRFAEKLDGLCDRLLAGSSRVVG